MDGECDRCGAQTRIWFWRIWDSSRLEFCKHHGEEHEPALRSVGFHIAQDERPLLVSPLH